MNTHAYTRSAVVVWVLCKCAACLKGFGVRARALFVLIPKRKRRVKHLLVVVVLVSLPLSLKAATRRAGGPRGLFLPDVQHCQNAKSSEPPCPKSASENFLFGSALHNGFFHTSPHKHTHTHTARAYLSNFGMERSTIRNLHLLLERMHTTIVNDVCVIMHTHLCFAQYLKCIRSHAEIRFVASSPLRGGNFAEAIRHKCECVIASLEINIRQGCGCMCNICINS